MKKKILSLFLIGIVILSGFGAVAIPKDNARDAQTIEKAEILTFSKTTLETYDQAYMKLSLQDEETYVMHPGQPMMTQITKHIELPFGATQIEINVQPNSVTTGSISKQILPAPLAVPLTTETQTTTPSSVKDPDIYQKNELYPSSWFDYSIGVGLNEAMQRVTHLSLHLYPNRYNPVTGELYHIDAAEITLTYTPPNTDDNGVTDAYDLLVIAPAEFADALQPLLDHKNSFGIDTILKTTEDIYEEYDGRDCPEQIKYCIKDAIETWDITYVLLIGGLTSTVYAKARDDENQGTSGWHIPVRYTNMDEAGEPGIIADLYYADIYEYEDEGPVFDDWDSNGNDIFAEWGFTGDQLDLYPDVSSGRLACRSIEEVNTLVNKIITYEQSKCDESWFNKILGITGDGFLDQEDLNFQWDTNSLPDGAYTISAQSINDEGESGLIDTISITLDKTQATQLGFNHDDHLQIENYPSYPHPPIAEIVSVSNGDILGNTDYTYSPGDSEAYCNDFTGWGNVEYTDGVLSIRGKSYDPKLYGNITDIHVWIENSENEIVFDDWRYQTKMFSEGDWTVGDQMLNGRAGSFYYMPEDFEKVMLSSSNGWTTTNDVIDAISEGSGFLFFSGHGSPNVWMNHFPGIPGNRHAAEVMGLRVSTLQIYPPFYEFPLFPMDTLSNQEKLPVAVVGGCHNSMFSVSAIPAVMHMLYIVLGQNNWMHTYGKWVPETFSWYIVKVPNGGAIASIGNTGYGYGILGEWCTSGGVDNWITTEFFRQYGTEGQTVLGAAYSQAINSYINEFGKRDSSDVQTVQQWVLLGDPTLQLGGYE